MKLRAEQNHFIYANASVSRMNSKAEQTKKLRTKSRQFQRLGAQHKTKKLKGGTSREGNEL